MKDIIRIGRIIKKITTIWYTHPELRFLQLINNIYTGTMDAYFCEDEDFEKMLDEYAMKYSKGE